MFEDFKAKFQIQKENIILPDIQEFFIDKTDIKQALEYLKTSPCLFFERLECIIGRDNGSLFTVTYILQSDKYASKCALSCNLDYDNAEIDSALDIYKSADYDEREIYDLFGIKFLNRPNLKRILLPVDFIGHPLRKNYKMEEERLKWNYE